MMNCGCLVIAIQLFFALSLLKEDSVDQFITPTGLNLHLGKPLRSGESTQLAGLIQRLSHILLQQSSRDILFLDMGEDGKFLLRSFFKALTREQV